MKEDDIWIDPVTAHSLEEVRSVYVKLPRNAIEELRNRDKYTPEEIKRQRLINQVRSVEALTGMKVIGDD